MSLMFLLFGFMLVTLSLGLLLGWLIWSYDSSSDGKSASTTDTEINFWRTNLDHCRIELGNEKDAVASLREERVQLKNRIKALEQASKK